MGLKKQIHTENNLVINDNRHPIEILFSLPFLFAGGYFIFQILRTFYEYIPSASFSDWLAAIPGLLVLLILAILIGGLGVFLAAAESLAVDLKMRVIGKRRQLLFFHTKGKYIELDKIDKIICRTETKQRTNANHKSTSVYIVDLIHIETGKAQLIEFKNKEDAKEVGQTLSDFTKIPLNDRL